MPFISLVVPSLGLRDYLGLFFRTLATTWSTHAYEVCLGINGEMPDVQTYGAPLRVAADPTKPGFSHAMDRAMALAEGEWIGTMNDDVAFLPFWEDFDGRLRKDRVLAWDLIEPGYGSWPPPSDAGDSPRRYRPKDAEKEAVRRKRTVATPGNFFGLYVFHRSLLDTVPYAERLGLDVPTCQDIDFDWRLYQAFPDLLFGQLGLCLYHFQGATAKTFPQTQVDGDLTQRAFMERHGLTTGEAYRKIHARSVRLWTD